MKSRAWNSFRSKGKYPKFGWISQRRWQANRRGNHTSERCGRLFRGKYLAAFSSVLNRNLFGAFPGLEISILPTDNPLPVILLLVLRLLSIFRWEFKMLPFPRPSGEPFRLLICIYMCLSGVHAPTRKGCPDRISQPSASELFSP